MFKRRKKNIKYSNQPNYLHCIFVQLGPEGQIQNKQKQQQNNRRLSTLKKIIIIPYLYKTLIHIKHTFKGALQ